MEKDRNPSEELQSVGRQAADALRGYGYPDLAGEYERTLHRAALDSKEMLAHSRMASTALKELNTLAEERQGRHPALERTIQLQERLDAALQPEKQAEVSKSIEEPSFLAKSELKENRESLGTAAQEVVNYLREKRVYSRTGITELEEKLGEQLAAYRSSPDAHTLGPLETHTRQGMAVMKEDFREAKEAMQQENEDYIRERSYLSEEGKDFILKEAQQGQFQMPNGQKGYLVESRINYAEQQLEHFTKSKEQGMGKDQQQPETSPWKQALASPALEQQTSEQTHSDSTIPVLQGNYPQLSSQQQDRYASLQSAIQEKSRGFAPEKNQGLEL